MPWSAPRNLRVVRRLVPVLLALALPATAVAQDPPATTPAPPVKPKLSVDLQKVGHAAEPVAFAGRGFRVRGTVDPYVPGQWVKVSVYLKDKLLTAKTRKVEPVGDGAVGMFVANLSTTLRGKMRVVTTKTATPQQEGAEVRSGPVHVIDSSLDYGQSGYSVEVMQRLLRDKGYVVGRYGVLDARTARAVHAFRKLEEMARSTEANGPMLRRLVDGGGEFAVRYPEKGHHVEADLTHQVLALIDKGKVERIYPISSGKPSTPTVLGSWRVYYRIAGLSPKGLIFPSFFIRGYAVHGWKDVPPYPASAGCLRVPAPDAVPIYNWIRPGDWVSTYYRGATPRGVAAFNPNPGP